MLTGAVARVVFQQAVARLPTSLSLRQRLLQVLQPFRFPGEQGGGKGDRGDIWGDCAGRRGGGWGASGVTPCLRMCICVCRL